MKRLALAVAVLFVGLPAFADSIIFNNFGPGQTYNPGGFTVRGADFGTILSAMAFVPKGRFDLTQISVGITWFLTGTNDVVLSLNTDNSGIPGAVIGSWSFTNLPPTTAASSNIVQTMTFTPGIVLQSGQTYWIVASPIASDSWMVWGQNLTGRISTAASTADGVWFVGPGVAGAFEVRGTGIVPEPDTLLLLGTGLLGIWSFVHRSRAPHS